jgi:dCTP diphosphatase
MISKSLLEDLIQFRREREWEQFHTVRNLSAALCVEASELLDQFRWARDSEIDGIVEQKRFEIENELADVSILISYLCHDLGLSIEDIVRKKLEINREKYPIEKARGNAKKYSELI